MSTTLQTPVSEDILRKVEANFNETKTVKQEERDYCAEGLHERFLIENSEKELVGLGCLNCSDVMRIVTEEKFNEHFGVVA